jgi:hypothetical protein
MSWTRYLFHDFWTATALNEMEDNLARHRFAVSRMRTNHKRREGDLEDEIGRLALMVHALTNACIKKGVLTKDEIAVMMHELDLQDGVQDGQLRGSKQPPQRDA